MRIVRDFLTAVALVTLTAISVAAAVLVARQPLPSSPVEDRRQVWEWLTNDDLAATGAEARQKLLRRVEAELDRGLDWSENVAQLDDDGRERLRANVAILAQTWFLSMVDRYHELPEAERSAFLDQRIAEVERRSGTVAQLASGMGESDRFSLQMLAPMLGQLEAWTDEAPPAQRERIRQFQSALQDRFLARELERAFGPDG
jgi:hypothetical protein